MSWHQTGWIRTVKRKISALYYKHTTIVNYDSSVVDELEALLTDDARVVIYYCDVFIVKATEVNCSTNCASAGSQNQWPAL